MSKSRYSDARPASPEIHNSVDAEGDRGIQSRRNRRTPQLEAESPHRPGAAQQRPAGNERLYEAYNDLHALAQVFEKPFDAPAILVVGHQTDGKSALVEALMGFQFNSVGGGTKTRRPIALHMKYNSSCSEPSCFLMNDDMQEREMGLEDLQAYIEQENNRLEAEQMFWHKEIVVRIEYKYCPNLTIIDTPGLISAAPGKKNSTLQGFSQQVEAMVRTKMEQREHIILCLEDTNDWNNATTRRLVMQVDPNLARTMLVSTKFDTKLPQFARGCDVDMFLHPAAALGLGDSAAGQLGGSPFFTSVPSGRIGNDRDAVFRTNEEFRAAVAQREIQDVEEVETKLGRRLDKAERSHLGVSQLRHFLEQLLKKRYLESVPSIVPLLEKESRSVQARLDSLQQELNGLAHDKLTDKGRALVEAFLTKLQMLLKGTVSASPEKFGENLADEQLRGGSYVGTSGKLLPVPDVLPNASMRLFGGAQFHRAMAEFRLAVGQIQCPDVTKEEIANACGVDDFHDGVNYMRTACVIAVTRSQEMFEPLLHQLGHRLSHVVRRLLPISLHLLQRDSQLPAGFEIFTRRLSTTFSSFIEEVEKSCRHRCQEDLQSTTRYVTWSLHSKNTRGLRALLSRSSSPGKQTSPASASKDAASQQQQGGTEGVPNLVVLDLMEGTLTDRQLSMSSEQIIVALVHLVFEGIRDFVIQSAELKFNCFFLMPLIDTFPMRLRSEVEKALDEDLDEVFDVSAVRAVLESRQQGYQAELQQMEKLQRKFSSIHVTLVQQQAYAARASEAAGPGGPAGGGPGSHARFDLEAHMLSLTDSVATVALGGIGAAVAAAAAATPPLKVPPINGLKPAPSPLVSKIPTDSVDVPLIKQLPTALAANLKSVPPSALTAGAAR